MDSEELKILLEMNGKLGALGTGQDGISRYIDNVSNRLRALDDRQQKHELAKEAHGMEAPGRIKDRWIALAGVFISLMIGVSTILVELNKGGKNHEKENAVVVGDDARLGRGR